MMPRDTVLIECSRERETDNAILIRVREEMIWIPLSQVDTMHFDRNWRGNIEITRWIAGKKGLL